MKSERQELNAFQLLMKEWAALAPYNGIHAMRLDSPANIGRWRKAVDSVANELGLTGEIPIEQPATDLESHLNTEMSRPFADQAAPMRFFIIDSNAGGHWFGIVFDHWLADDFSCRALLQRAYSNYSGDANANSAPLYYSSAPPPRHGLIREWIAFVRESRRMRRACRIPIRGVMDFDSRTFRMRLPDDALEQTRDLARKHDASIHDIFLAAALAASGAALKWRSGETRNAVAILSAMDARRFEPEPARSSFGLRLGQYIVLERRPHELPFGELITRVAAQTRRMKTGPRTELFAPALALWKRTPSNRAKATFFMGGAPLVAGLSNVNLTGSWIEKCGIADIRRIGPCGPIIPLLLVVTTLHGRMFLDVTYRTASFAAIDAEQLTKKMIERLPSRATSPRPVEHRES